MSEEITDTMYVDGNVSSKLRFLAESMKDREWHTRVILPPKLQDDVAKIDALQKDLQGRGIRVRQQTDIHGKTVLELSYAPDKESGFSSWLSSGADYLKGVATDSARMIGAIYLVGDFLVTAAPMLNKSAQTHAGGLSSWQRMMQGLRDPYNQAQYFQGATTILQSLVYMHYARDGKEVLLHDLKENMEHARKEGLNPLDTHAWREAQIDHSLWDRAGKFLHENAIATGAGLMMAGQAAYIAGGFIRRKRWANHLKDLKAGKLDPKVSEFLETFKAGQNISEAEKIRLNQRIGLFEMLRGSLSVATWATFIRNTKEIDEDEKVKWSEQPGKRFMQELDSGPQRFASVMSMASSAFGMWAGADKGNLLQKFGEGTYLGADALMFVTKKKDYGKDNAGQDDALAAAGAEFIANAPFAIGPSKEAEFIKELAEYFVAQQQEKGDAPANAQERIALVRQGIGDLLDAHETTYDRMVEAAGILASHFPKGESDKLIDRIAEVISRQHDVFATKEDVAGSIHLRADRFDLPALRPIPSEVTVILDQLVKKIPSLTNPRDVVELYEAVEDGVYLKPTGKAPELHISKVEHDGLQGLNLREALIHG